MQGKTEHSRLRALLILAVALVMAISVALSGCGSTTDKKTSTDKKPAIGNVVAGDGKTITVGTDATFAPMELMDTSNQFQGFDVELMKAIGKDMGAEVKFVNVPWDALLTALSTNAGQFDMAASSMTITAERSKTIKFSDPYFVSVQALSVPKGSSVKTVDDLKKGMKVAVQNGTTGHIWSKDNLIPKGIVVKPYQGGQDCFTAMAAGEVDAVVIDGPVAGNYTKQATYKAENRGSIQGAATENFGFAFPMDKDKKNAANPELLAAVNKSLKNVIADGTYEALYKKFIDDKNPPVMP
ncbi:MAG: basic amino acid ABC transporter substrate-binding protein [Actinomycetia bacterium]|nr:basic amino acid ABC transporter substrate-binding protein [Actinomycetes bacterium]